jgi:hypothetical protein
VLTRAECSQIRAAKQRIGIYLVERGVDLAMALGQARCLLYTASARTVAEEEIRKAGVRRAWALPRSRVRVRLDYLIFTLEGRGRTVLKIISQFLPFDLRGEGARPGKGL